jgi:hypothetical protein
MENTFHHSSIINETGKILLITPEFVYLAHWSRFAKNIQTNTYIMCKPILLSPHCSLMNFLFTQFDLVFAASGGFHAISIMEPIYKNPQKGLSPKHLLPPFRLQPPIVAANCPSMAMAIGHNA